MAAQTAEKPLRGYKLFIEAMAAIKDHPEHWDQSTWVCDTGMCLAGWATSVAGAKIWLNGNPDPDAVDVESIVMPATRFPDLTYEDRRYVATSIESVMSLAALILGSDGTKHSNVYQHWIRDLFDGDNTFGDLVQKGASYYAVSPSKVRRDITKARARGTVDVFLKQVTNRRKSKKTP